MNIDVHWKYAGDPDDPDDWLDFRRVLYAYLHPKSHQPLYLGKADRLSVRERLCGKHKDGVFRYFNEIGVNSVWVIVGLPVHVDGGRLSVALLSDIESLLIHKLRPCANIQSVRTRISRPGMLVTCRGEWPLRRRNFEDLV